MADLWRSCYRVRYAGGVFVARSGPGEAWVGAGWASDGPLPDIRARLGARRSGDELPDVNATRKHTLIEWRVQSKFESRHISVLSTAVAAPPRSRPTTSSLASYAFRFAHASRINLLSWGGVPAVANLR